MRTLREHSRHNSYLVVFICLGCLTFLSACGGSGGGSEGAAASTPTTGSIVLDLEWEEPNIPGTSFTAQVSERDACIDYGIEQVAAVVRNASGTIVASETWPCSAHSGIIEEVPAGSNISIIVDGLIESSPKWRAEIQDLVVIAGETTIIPKVLMGWIPPFISDDPEVRPIKPLDGAIEVPIDVVITAEFNVEMVQSTINSTTCTLSEEKAGKVIPCSVAYDPLSFELTMTPTSPLLISTPYIVNISPLDVEDTTGRNLTGVSQWKFTTVEEKNWYKDSDGDGYSDGTLIKAVEQPEGYYLAADLNGISGDCDDDDDEVHPGVDEICDGKDNDCDNQIDEGLSTDADKDGHYTAGSCFEPADDCNDNDQDIYPGKAELCDGKDNDCDGQIDEGLSTDADKDGHYTVGSCLKPADDCNDSDASINPGKAEICDGKDNDCNSATPDGSVEAWFGTSCDGDDNDLCMEGTFSCSGGIQSCSDYSPDNIEVCDGNDNDCNPATADGSAETWIGDECDGLDSDECDEGILSCLNGEEYCSDDTPDNEEICNEIDDDCDDKIDEGIECAYLLGITIDSWLVTFDPYSGEIITTHGRLSGEERYWGLTYNWENNLMYTLSPNNNKLYSINPAGIERFGIDIPHNDYSTVDMYGLTYYPIIHLPGSSNTLLASVPGDSEGLYTDFLNIDIYTANVESLRDEYGWFCTSLCYSRQDEELYGLCKSEFVEDDYEINTNKYKLVRLEYGEGGFSVSELVNTGYDYLNGLAKKPGANIFFSGVYGDGKDAYVEINKDTKNARLLDSNNQIGVILETMLYKDFFVGYQSSDGYYSESAEESQSEE